MVHDTPYDVLCQFGLQMASGGFHFSESGCLCYCVSLDGLLYYQLNLAVLGSNTARLLSLMRKMRLTTSPTNQGIVPGVSQKYKIRYFRPNDGEEWLPVALVGFQVF